MKQNPYLCQNLTVMFIAAFFFCNHQTLETTSKRPSLGEWISKSWHKHTVKWYSATPKNAPIHTAIWVNLKCITLSERSHSQKATYCIHPFVWHSRKDEKYEHIKQISGLQRSAVGGDLHMKRWHKEIIGVLELFCILSVEELIRPYSF